MRRRGKPGWLSNDHAFELRGQRKRRLTTLGADGGRPVRHSPTAERAGRCKRQAFGRQDWRRLLVPERSAKRREPVTRASEGCNRIFCYVILALLAGCCSGRPISPTPTESRRFPMKRIVSPTLWLTLLVVAAFFNASHAAEIRSGMRTSAWMLKVAARPISPLSFYSIVREEIIKNGQSFLPVLYVV